MIAAILKTLREQLTESDQLHSDEEISGPVPTILLSMIKFRKKEEDSGMISTMGICQKILCWLRDVKKLIGYILKVSTHVCGSDTQKKN